MFIQNNSASQQHRQWYSLRLFKYLIHLIYVGLKVCGIVRDTLTIVAANCRSNLRTTIYRAIVIRKSKKATNPNKIKREEVNAQVRYGSPQPVSLMMTVMESQQESPNGVQQRQGAGAREGFHYYDYANTSAIGSRWGSVHASSSPKEVRICHGSLLTAFSPGYDFC